MNHSHGKVQDSAQQRTSVIFRLGSTWIVVSYLHGISYYLCGAGKRKRNNYAGSGKTFPTWVMKKEPFWYRVPQNSSTKTFGERKEKINGGVNNVRLSPGWENHRYGGLWHILVFSATIIPFRIDRLSSELRSKSIWIELHQYWVEGSPGNTECRSAFCPSWLCPPFTSYKQR